jgi:hypothetical protein
MDTWYSDFILEQVYTWIYRIQQITETIFAVSSMFCLIYSTFNFIFLSLVIVKKFIFTEKG